MEAGLRVEKKTGRTRLHDDFHETVIWALYWG